MSKNKTIGLTYDLKDDYLKMGFSSELVAEFDSIETINAIDEALVNYGYDTIRIGNIYNLVKFLADGNKVDLVFNICEGLYGSSREAQVPSLLEAYNIDCVFSNAEALTTTLNKAIAKTIIAKAGLRSARFVVIEKEEDIEGIDISYPLFAKPLFGGTGQGISSKSIVNNEFELKAEVNRQLEIYKQPILVEKYLEGREFTVGIVGNGKNARAIATMEIAINPDSDKGVYSYLNKSNYKEVAKYSLVEGLIKEKAEELAISSYKALNCRDASRIDLRMDKKGNLYFLEVNPLAGLNPLDSDLPIMCYLKNMKYQELINSIMDSVNFRLEKL
ncbi:MAG: ATP-grasp domain-containing protein [Spirochaetaceae bacterium]|nr:ATP-grasp domain-containing protein [Spirochaetaceae bacterium]